MKILWRSEKDKITFKAIEKHRYVLRETVSKHLKRTSVDMFPRSQSLQIPAFIRNYTSKIACFLTLLDVCILSLPLKANLIKTTTFMAFLGESINILNHRPQKILDKNHAHKTEILNQRAQRHSNHRSVLLETNEYKLSLRKSCFFRSCVRLKESSLGFLEDCHFHFRFELKNVH